MAALMCLGLALGSGPALADADATRDSLERLEQAGATEFIAMEACRTEAEAARTRELLRRFL